jgi:hypothetical protein
MHRRNPKGYRSDTTYKSWKAMRERCNNPRKDNYHLYGGRGITVCPEWNSYPQFLADMGPRPDEKTLGRLDGNGNYCKENCAWQTLSEQNSNRRILAKVPAMRLS